MTPSLRLWAKTLDCDAIGTLHIKLSEILLTDKTSVGDEETKGVYDTIEYDDTAGYEIPDHVFSHDGLNRSYDVIDVPFKDRIPSDYEDPDKALNANDDELTFLSSQYITTIPDPDKETTLTNDPEDRYTHLRHTDAGNRKSEEGAGNEQASYLEIVGDEDERKTTRESGIGRRSSSSEGSEENNKAPEATANYTQLMPESGYTRLVL